MLKAVQLGNSGLRVSQLCLGTMNFGIPGRGHQGDWTLTLDEARPILKAAIDHGLFYFDLKIFSLEELGDAFLYGFAHDLMIVKLIQEMRKYVKIYIRNLNQI